MAHRGKFPVILASASDFGARHLLAFWGDARLVTPGDLASPGWRYYSNRDHGTIAISGATFSTDEISGVVTRVPCVFPRELVSIVPEDREYVAAEMTAFLAAWLTRLRCPVLNRPAATSLWGPALHPQGWVHLASQLGIPVTRITTRVGDGASPATAAPHPEVTVTVVGDRATVSRGSAGGDNDLPEHALRLARAVSVQLLCVRFGLSDRRYVFAGADYLPDVTRAEIAGAIRSHLHAPGRCLS